MVRVVGLLDKIRMVKESPMMVRFTLTTINKPYNCIVVKHYTTIKELSVLPPIKIIIGEFGLLRLQVETLAKKLDESSNKCFMTIYPGMIHAKLESIMKLKEVLWKSLSF